MVSLFEEFKSLARGGVKVLAVKPGTIGSHVVLMQRHKDSHRAEYVTGTVTAHSLEYGEWFWGHYFETLEAAQRDFNDRTH